MNYNEDDLTELDLTKNNRDGSYEDQMSQSEVRSISRRYFYMFIFGFVILVTLSSLGFALFQQNSQKQIAILKTENAINQTIQAYKSTLSQTQTSASIIQNEVTSYLNSEDETDLAYRRNYVKKLLVTAPKISINSSIYNYIALNDSMLIVKGEIPSLSKKDFQKIYAYYEVSRNINAVLNKDQLNLSFKRIVVASHNISLVYPLKKEDIKETILNNFKTHVTIFSKPLLTLENKLSESGDINFVSSAMNVDEGMNVAFQPKTNIFNFRYKRNIHNKDKSIDNIFVDFEQKTQIFSNTKINSDGEIIGNVYFVDKNSNILYSNHLKEKNNILFNLSYLDPPISLNEIRDQKDKTFFSYFKYKIYKEPINTFGWNFLYVIPDNYWNQYISKTSYLVFAKTFTLGILAVILGSIFVYLLFVRPSYVLSRLLLAVFDQQEARSLRNLVQDENKFLLGSWYRWFLKVNKIVYKIVSDYNILYQVMNYDDHTHLPNEKHFHFTIKEMATNLKQNEKLVVAMFTLREFDDIIKIFDVSGADAVVQTIAFRLKSVFGLKEDQTIARFSLYTFSIAFKVNVKSEQAHIEEVLANIMKDIIFTVSIKGQNVNLNSVLIYTEVLETAYLDDNLELALIQFLNKTYSNGEALQRYTTAQNISLENNVAMYNKLHDTIVNKDINYHYQPQIDTTTGKMVGIEAFMRWKLDGKIIPPGTFIPFINNSGLLSTISLKLIHTALIDLKLFMELSKNPDLIISFNISTRQALDLTFIQGMCNIIDESDVAFENIGIEIREEVLDPNESLEYKGLQILQSKGVHVRIGNLGSTYLSIADLSHKQYDECKIDRDVISKLGTPEGNTHFNTMVTVVKDLGMKTVIIEGVNDIDTILQIQAKGFNIMQSYFLCPPMSFEELSARIGKGFRKVNK